MNANNVVELVGSGSQERPYLKGTFVSFPACALDEVAPDRNGEKLAAISTADTQAKSGLLATVMVTLDVAKSFEDLGCPPEVMALVRQFLASKGRYDGTLPYVASVHVNTSQSDGHQWIGFKSNLFQTKRPEATAQSAAQG